MEDKWRKVIPSEVKSAAKATEIAASFLKQYYTASYPISAVRENDTWIVKIDVALIGKKIAEVKIDVLTADVIGYSLPE